VSDSEDLKARYLGSYPAYCLAALPLRRSAFQELVVRKLSPMLTTILWNFGNGIAKESVFLPT